MSADLMLDLENQPYPVMDNETDIISIDQGGEWGKRRLASLSRKTHTVKEAQLVELTLKTYNTSFKIWI